MRAKPRKNHYMIRYQLIQAVTGFHSGQVVGYHTATYKRQIRGVETWEQAVEKLTASVQKVKGNAEVRPLIIWLYDPWWDDFNRPPWVVVYQRKEEESPDE